MKPFNSYNQIYFDCDGVILNSNSIKSISFYDTVSKFFGEQIAVEFVEYHRSNGGISRYSKFEYLLNSIIPRHRQIALIPDLQILLDDFSERVINIWRIASMKLLFTRHVKSLIHLLVCCIWK